MADDILNRLKKHTIKGRKKINGRHRYCTWCDIIDEIELLRTELSAVLGDAIAKDAENERLQAEIERLRAAGDALAEECWNLRSADDAVKAWQEARRG